jgi:L-iditol 2-dehydrogenase
MMKTAVLTGIKAMDYCEAPMPCIARDYEVLLRVAAVGVCGSDVHYYASGRIGSQVVKYPFVVGHECSAVVEQVGRSVTRVRAGDRVAVEPAISCWTCDQCLQGRPHTCRNLSFLGCPGQAEGCLSEFIVMPEDCCYPIPASMTFEQAAISEPLSIGVYAITLAEVMPGARVGILGAGPIGLSVLIAAREAGASAVYMTDRRDARTKVALAAGATWAGNPDREDVVGAIVSAEPLLLDVVVECCGQQEAVDQAAALLKPGGKLMMVGIPEADRISLPIDVVRRKEICFQNVRRQNHCLQAALNLIAGGRVNMDFMVTHRFPFSETHEAFALVHEYGDGVVKAMVSIHGGNS